MLQTNPYRRIASGLRHAKIIVGKQTAYTAHSTYAAFEAGAADGEIGIFNADTKALITAASTDANLRVFIAQKRGSVIHKTVSYNHTASRRSRTNYSAPVKQVTVVSGQAKASGKLGSMIYTAKAGGADGNDLSVVHVVAGNSTALSVSVTGDVITVNLATSAGGVATSTASQVKTAIEGSTSANALISVAIEGSTSAVQGAGTADLYDGATFTPNPNGGDELFLQVTDLTPQQQPYPTFQYSVVLKPGEGLESGIAKLVAQINSDVAMQNRDRDRIVTATASGTDITLTGVEFYHRFKVQLRGGFGNGNAVATTTVKNSYGSGVGMHVVALEEEGFIFEGWNTSHPNLGIPSDYGKPTPLASPTETYNIFQIEWVATEKALTPHNYWSNPNMAIIAVPSTGTNPTSSLNTIFGL